MSSYGEVRDVFAVPFGVRVIAAARAAIRPVQNVARAISRRHELAVLGGLNDHMLRDMGIDRGDLHDAASQPLWMDSTQVLVARSVERRASRLLHLRAMARQPGE